MFEDLTINEIYGALGQLEFDSSRVGQINNFIDAAISTLSTRNCLSCDDKIVDDASPKCMCTCSSGLFIESCVLSRLSSSVLEGLYYDCSEYVLRKSAIEWYLDERKESYRVLSGSAL